jgi:D-alanine transaminase
MITYFNNTYLDKEHVRISPDDRGFLFADGLYEVIRSYGGRLFRMQQHIERLNYGATELRLPTTDFNYLSEVAVELLKRNNLEQSDATVYFQVTRGAAKRGHAFPEPQPQLTIYGIATAFDSQPSQEKMRVGIKAITLGDQRWSRCDMKTIGLTANILANQAAKEAGAQEAILVRDGVLLEGTHSNFMAVFGDTIVTAPTSNYILSGITRMAILELCAAQGFKLELKPIFAKDIALASEAFIVGTTVEVTPICHLDGNPVGSGEPGPIVRLLQKHLRETILKNL